MKFSKNTISKSEFKKVGKIIAFFVMIVVVVIVVVISAILVYYLTIYTSQRHEKIDVNIDMTGGCNTELDAYNFILKNYAEDISGIPLTCVETTVSKNEIDCILSFARYIDSSAEGGRTEFIKFYIDIDEKIITAIEYFNGSSKAMGLMSCERIANTDILDYNLMKNKCSEIYNTGDDYTNFEVKYLYNGVRVTLKDEENYFIGDYDMYLEELI